MDASLVAAAISSLLAGGAGFLLGLRRIGGARHRLRESEARSNAVLDAAVDGIVTIDERGRIQSFNRAAERIFGHAAAEVIGKNVKVLMPPPYRGEHDGYLSHYMSTGQAHVIGIGREVEGLRKDGTTFPMDLAVGEGRVAGRRIFAGICRDISARKAVEDDLRASEERFRVLVEGISDYAIVLLDSLGRVLSWNSGAEHLYGWPAEDVIGQPVDRFYPDEAVKQGLHERALAAARAKGRFEEEGWRMRKDGSRFWAHIAITALQNRDGTLRGFARISRDMTPAKRHEDALRIAKEEAERARDEAEKTRAGAEKANRTKTKFLAAASHDLRQPVQAIIFFASVLAHKLRNHSARSLVEDLQRSLEGQNILLDSLLDVSKLDAGLVVPKVTDFAAAAVLDRIAADFAPTARDKGLKLSVVPSSATVRSDPTLLARIIQNLVANAIRYTRRGHVLVGCRHDGDNLRIEVWDTGIGIPPERIREIFEEFTQIGNPERDRNQGLGLGLAIVDRLSRLLDHRVQVRSVPDRGSVFSVTVPQGTCAGTGRRRHAADGEAAGDSRLVLLIDDEPIVLKGLAMVLKGWGYEVLAAGSADEALALLNGASRPPALILADYRLREGRTGTEAIQLIRDLYKAAIPSIIITGDTAPERLREAEASGLSVMHKPVQPPALRAVLRESLEGGPTLH
jgi:PAS domain S-box-containing protein